MKSYTEWKKLGIIWICGGIDSYGHVIGHAYYIHSPSSESCHTPKEASISSWRWDVNNQNFMDHFIPPKRQLTKDEWFKVQDWLVKNGYAEDDSFKI